MNEQQHRQQIHKAIGSTLSGLQADPFLHGRVMAMAAQPEKGAVSMRHAKVIALAVLIALLLTGTVALTAGFPSRYYSWDGELLHQDNARLDPSTAAEIDDHLAQSMRTTRGGTFELAMKEGSNQFIITPACSYRCSSIEDLQQMPGYDAAFPLPARIPEGYTLKGAFAAYVARPGATFHLVEEERYGEDVVKYYYQLDPEDEFFFQATLSYIHEDTGDYLTLMVRYDEPLREGQGFWVREGGTVTTIDIPGMEDAIIMRRSDSDHRLLMRRTLDEPITCWEFSQHVRPLTNGAYARSLYERTFTDLVIEVMTSEPLDAAAFAALYDLE